METLLLVALVVIAVWIPVELVRNPIIRHRNDV